MWEHRKVTHHTPWNFPEPFTAVCGQICICLPFQFDTWTPTHESRPGCLITSIVWGLIILLSLQGDISVRWLTQSRKLFPETIRSQHFPASYLWGPSSFTTVSGTRKQKYAGNRKQNPNSLTLRKWAERDQKSGRMYLVFRGTYWLNSWWSFLFLLHHLKHLKGGFENHPRCRFPILICLTLLILFITRPLLPRIWVLTV